MALKLGGIVEPTNGNVATVAKGRNLTTDQKAAITTALRKINARRDERQRFINYYNGSHELNFASTKYRTNFARRLASFADNLCGVAVRAPADRLQVVGFSKETESEFYNQSWTIWKRSQMPRYAKEIHRSAFKVGDAYLVVFRDENGKSRMWPQDPRNCAVWYDEDGDRVAWGAKIWRDDVGVGAKAYVYLTLYYPDRIEKYRSKNTQSTGDFPATAASFEIRDVDGEEFPLMHNYGRCPMFHFGLEKSILTDVIPLNNGLNKSSADMLIASEANSFRQRWASGITFETDPETGAQIVPFKDDQKYISSDLPESRFGQFPDSQLSDFVTVLEYWTNRVANVSGIPAWYFNQADGSFPSGEALARSESPFVSIVADAQNDFGETWSEAMRMCMQIDGFGPAAETPANNAESDDAEIETVWTPAAMVTPNEAADLGLKKKNLGVSRSRVLSELGYTDAEIAKMETENAAAAESAAASFSKAFDSGAIDSTPAAAE